MLKEGSKAPLFRGKDQDGKTISLKDYLGKKLILYFYPHDNTPTCTVQACNLRDNFTLLAREGFNVLGISTDDVRSHTKFKQKYNLPFPLIADADYKIVNKYEVWGEKKFMGRVFDGTHRTTFLIDENGIIRRIIRRPKSKYHAEEVVEAWKQLTMA